MVEETQLASSLPSAPRLGSSPDFLAWFGVAPFFIFAVMFLILPTGYLVIGAFKDPSGNFTLETIGELFQPQIISAYWVSFKLSAITALAGAVVGFFLAYAGVIGGLPRWIRPTLMTFSGVASNFAGIPLAFAFMATLGRVGLVTTLLIKFFDFNIYSKIGRASCRERA